MNILLVDDHAAIRNEIAALIEKEADLTVVGQATYGREGVRQAGHLRPDVIVMDLMMPGMNGIDATMAIRKSLPDVRVLALSNHTGSHLVDVVLQAGASGFVRKDRAYEELIPAIRAVANGESYIGEGVKG